MKNTKGLIFVKPEDFHCYKVALLTGNPGYLDEKGMEIELNKMRREPLTGFPVICNHEDFMRHLEWFESLFVYPKGD